MSEAAESSYVGSGFEMMERQYPLSVSNADQSIIVRRYARDCPPSQVNYICQLGEHHFKFRAQFALDLPRFCEVVSVSADQFSTCLARVKEETWRNEPHRLFLQIAPAINELSLLFRGRKSGTTLKSFEAVLIAGDHTIVRSTLLPS